MDVTAISVAYHSKAELAVMAATLPPGVPLVVVDNAAEPGLADWATEHGVRLIAPQQNLGFGAACNLGAAGVDSAFLFFVNPDVRLELDCLESLVAAAARLPDGAAFGPLLRMPSGACGFKRRSAIAPADRFAPVGLPDAPCKVPVLEGSALLIRRAAFEAVGGFDPKIFLYFEDDDLSLRLRARVGPLYLVPEAVARHRPGTSSPQTAAVLRMKGFHHVRSHVYAARKHGLPLPALLGWVQALAFVLSPRAREPGGWQSARGRIAGAWAGMWRR